MTPLEEHLAKFPYHVFIPFNHERDQIYQERLDWFRAQPGGYHDFIAGPFGWVFGENCASIFCETMEDPWHYIFKDAKTAVDFKLRFG